MDDLLKFWNYMQTEFKDWLEAYEIDPSDFSEAALSRCSEFEIGDLFQSLIEVYFGVSEEDFAPEAPGDTLYSRLRKTMLEKLGMNEQTVEQVLAEAAVEDIFLDYGETMSAEEMYDIIDEISEALGLPEETVRLAIKKTEE